ncbi:MAG: alpha-amylase family glycosyl hydrolase, partial [Acetanaerobacterium sp.]
MKLVMALIAELSRLMVRTDEMASGALIAEIGVTRNGVPVFIAGAAVHGDGMGLDIFLSNEVELGETVQVTLRKVGITARIDYHLYDTPAFEARYFYGGVLGAAYTRKGTVFRLWSPAASEVVLHLYTKSDLKTSRDIGLTRGAKGVFAATVEGDLHGVLYTYDVTVGGVTNRCNDPYARTLIENARMGVVVDPQKTNPRRWETDAHILPQSPTDAVLYEVHVRDFTISPDSGVRHKGRFLGFAEENTLSAQGQKTALSHLVELGVTHVHLMPVMDYATVDETSMDAVGYNWGYDPSSYFVPDGSYCTDPGNGAKRIREFKTLVQALHRNGIGVVLDVVYNHTYFTENSPLNLVMPDYYYRKSAGSFSNGSGCGNELASERGMVRRLMIDSLLYWVNEYHVDG